MSNKIESKFDLQPKKDHGSIVLSNEVRVTDPCYDMDTWCAGTIENVLPGEFVCFSQKVDTGEWGIRVASIEIRHKDYPDVEPIEWVSSLDVGVDSGQCGLFDNEYFSSLCENDKKKDEFYDKVCDLTCKEAKIKNKHYTSFEESSFYKPEFKGLDVRPYEDVFADYKVLVALKKEMEENPDHPQKELIEKKLESYPLLQDFVLNRCRYDFSDNSREEVWGYSFEADVIDGKGFVSSSGDGDGSYACLVGRNSKGQVVSIKIDYYPEYELLEDKEEDLEER